MSPTLFFSRKEFNGALQKTRIGKDDVDMPVFLRFSTLDGGEPKNSSLSFLVESVKKRASALAGFARWIEPGHAD